jgi:hypothetical protein
VIERSDVHPPGIPPAETGALSERKADGASAIVSESKTPGGGESLPPPADAKPFSKAPAVHQGNGDRPNGQHSSVTTGSHAIAESATAARTDVDAKRKPLEPDVTKQKQNTTSTGDSQSRRLKMIHAVGLSAGIALVLLVYHRHWRSA